MMRQIHFQYITVCNGEVFIFMGTDIYTTRYNPRIPTPVAVGGLLYCFAVVCLGGTDSPWCWGLAKR